MTKVNLRPFVRPNLYVLFVALNPPSQSNSNGHYFSGRQSRFFLLLCKSGLITRDVDKSIADEIVFGSNKINYKEAQFGIADLVDDIVETKSTRIRTRYHHVEKLVSVIRELKPRIVCIIHSKVRDAINNSRHPDIVARLDYGNCGKILRGCDSIFFLIYFPNGNTVPDDPKLRIFREIREAI